MPKLFSYVVDHDYGFAPNPFGGFCTLAKCKYGTSKRNIVELAEVGDWIAGTGGVDLGKSAGHGKLLYAMRVDEKISLREYCEEIGPSLALPVDVVDEKISLREYCEGHRGNRIDADFDVVVEGRFALISYHYFYFGRNAIDVLDIPRTHLNHPFEKTGPGHRCDFSEEFVEEFAEWLKANFKVGVHGRPCKPHSDLRLSRCPVKVRRKVCMA